MSISKKTISALSWYNTCMHFLRIFITWRHIIFLMLFAMATFSCLIFLSHISFIIQVVSGHAGLDGSGIKLFLNTWYWSLKDLSVLQLTITALIAILFAMNAMSILYFIRIYRAGLVSTVSLLSLGGFTSALFGLLCISCGSLLIPLASSVFSVSFLFLLPFQEIGFSIMGMIFLCVSLLFSYKKLSRLPYRRMVAV